MGLRHVQCLILIMNLLFSSELTFSTTFNLAKEPEDSGQCISSSSSSVRINEEALNSTLQGRLLLPRPSSKPLTSMPQDGIVTPIPTVPAINPSTTPTYNPIPAESNPTIPSPYTTPSTGMPSSASGLSWCIVSQSASLTSLQVALDYACGNGGADCSQIQPGGSCFDPDTVRNHASYAFNNYYLKNPIPTGCDFRGNVRKGKKKP